MLAKKHESHAKAKEEEKARLKAKADDDDGKKFKKKDYKSIVHYKRKLYHLRVTCDNVHNIRVLTNLPPRLKTDELKEFFLTYLYTLDKKHGRFFGSSRPLFAITPRKEE